MEVSAMDVINELVRRHPSLESCRADIEEAAKGIISAYEKGGILIICGNGGSCSDADHIVGELMKGFVKRRPLGETSKAALDNEMFPDLGSRLQTPLRAISLTNSPALLSAFSNDVDGLYAYAQQAYAWAGPESAFLGISTSGNSKNVLAAAIVAKAKGAFTIGLTNATGGAMPSVFDCVIRAPETETYKTQELHLPIYHALCLAVESHFFKE
jgi:D-sedoheptulose 7-phosphate isomerase